MFRFQFRSKIFLFYLPVFFYLIHAFFCPGLILAGPKTQDQKTDLKAKNGEQGEIVFSTVFPEITPKYKTFKALYTEAFRRLGYGFQIFPYPSERALIDANSGRIDGVSSRIIELEIEKMYPNLIRVKEVIIPLTSIGLVMDSNIQIDGWKSLVGKGYKVTHIKGDKYIEKKLHNYLDRKSIIVSVDIPQALRKLVFGRVDIYIEIDDIIGFIPHIQEFKSEKFLNGGMVTRFMTYPYMNKKHVELAPRLAAVLREMKADGTYKKMFDSAGSQ
jgi:polar amino acid transport system substrate-binding protein